MVKLKEKNKKEFLNYILNAENIHFIRYRKNEREILRLNIEQKINEIKSFLNSLVMREFEGNRDIIDNLYFKSFDMKNLQNEFLKIMTSQKSFDINQMINLNNNKSISITDNAKILLNFIIDFYQKIEFFNKNYNLDEELLICKPKEEYICEKDYICELNDLINLKESLDKFLSEETKSIFGNKMRDGKLSKATTKSAKTLDETFRFSSNAPGANIELASFSDLLTQSRSVINSNNTHSTVIDLGSAYEQNFQAIMNLAISQYFKK
jgi:hypothetical protein